jgi:Domain of unknown function (DUF4160)
MPEVSRFYGIVIQIYFGDHPPPHFHAVYGGSVAKIEIDRLTIIDGRLPPRAMSLVTEWAKLHQAELREAFRRAANLQPPGKINPLP